MTHVKDYTQTFEHIRETCNDSVVLFKNVVANMPDYYEAMDKDYMIQILGYFWNVLVSCRYA